MTAGVLESVFRQLGHLASLLVCVGAALATAVEVDGKSHDVPASSVPSAPQPIRPDDIRYVTPPGVDGVEIAEFFGDTTRGEPYLIRVLMRAGARVPPHRHPDQRVTTVLSGTLYVGFAEVFDAEAAVAVPAGGVYAAPAGVVHFIWARDGAVEYQESANGPSGVTFLEP